MMNSWRVCVCDIWIHNMLGKVYAAAYPIHSSIGNNANQIGKEPNAKRIQPRKWDRYECKCECIQNWVLLIVWVYYMCMYKLFMTLFSLCAAVDFFPHSFRCVNRFNRIRFYSKNWINVMDLVDFGVWWKTFSATIDIFYVRVGCWNVCLFFAFFNAERSQSLSRTLNSWSALSKNPQHFILWCYFEKYSRE